MFCATCERKSLSRQVARVSGVFRPIRARPTVSRILGSDFGSSALVQAGAHAARPKFKLGSRNARPGLSVHFAPVCADACAFCHFLSQLFPSGLLENHYVTTKELGSLLSLAHLRWTEAFLQASGHLTQTQVRALTESSTVSVIGRWGIQSLGALLTTRMPGCQLLATCWLCNCEELHSKWQEDRPAEGPEVDSFRQARGHGVTAHSFRMHVLDCGTEDPSHFKDELEIARQLNHPCAAGLAHITACNWSRVSRVDRIQVNCCRVEKKNHRILL